VKEWMLSKVRVGQERLITRHTLPTEGIYKPVVAHWQMASFLAHGRSKALESVGRQQTTELVL